MSCSYLVEPVVAQRRRLTPELEAAIAAELARAPVGLTDEQRAEITRLMRDV